MRINSTLALTVIFLGLSTASFAQNDSTHLDAGSIVFKRDFTQNIRIKGEDLEKVPFSNLSDAINAWFYGGYSKDKTLLYVVDGVVTTDVNIYSVYDIEEVVLVQQAAAALNTAGSQQQLVLITTRRRATALSKGKLGLTAAAQTGIVNQAYHNYEQTKGMSSETKLYHQYYAGLDGNMGATSFGVSASYWHDVSPLEKASYSYTGTAPNLDRWRFNGYFTAQLGTHNRLEVHAAFAPQSYSYHLDPPAVFNGQYLDWHQHARSFAPWFRLHSKLLRGLTNDLQGSLFSNYARDQGSSYLKDTSGMVVGQPFATLQNSVAHADHFFARDRIAYSLKAGGWEILPAVNASYEHYSIGYSTTQISLTQSNSGLPGAPGTEVVMSAVSAKQKQWFITPTVDLTYKKVFDAQAGFRADISKYTAVYEDKKIHRIYPFASMSLDLLRAFDSSRHSRLQVFGSWAKRAPQLYPEPGLYDLGSDEDQSVGVSFNGSPYYFGTTTGTVQLSIGQPLPSFWIWQAGARYALAEDRLVISYQFERRNFITIGEKTFISPGGAGYDQVFPEFKSSQHHVSVDVKVLSEKQFKWQTGLHWTGLNSSAAIADSTEYQRPVGGWNSWKGDWTMGWVNRLECGGFIAGVDLLYRNGEPRVANAIPQEMTYIWELENVKKNNSFQLQNFFAGYRLQLAKRRPLEVYVNSRSLYQSSTSSLADRRRYYGIGGKLTI